MFTRIALMFVIIATLCCAAFSVGSRIGAVRQDATGIPPEHPIILALHYKSELQLDDEQTQKLQALKEAMEKEFAPLGEQAHSLEGKMEALQHQPGAHPEAAAELQKEASTLSAKIQPLFERYAKEVGSLLTDTQRQKLMGFAGAAAGHGPEKDGFVLNAMMQARDELGITPQQFTKLQYLQADFIRAFAPLREQMELLQIEIRDKFGKEGKTPTPEYVDRAAAIQKQVAALKEATSQQAETDVLDAKQRTKLEELLHGEHRSEPTGG